MAYQDLCERREKNHSKHQRALTKMQTAFKEKDRIANQGQRLVCVRVCVCVCVYCLVCVCGQCSVTLVCSEVFVVCVVQ